MPRFPRCILLAVLLCVVTCTRLRAVDAAHGSLAQRLVADSRDGALDEFELSSACLIAGGVTDPRELEMHRRAIAVLLAGASQQLPEFASGEKRAAAALEQLHGQVLTGKYDRLATDLRRVLADGNYNCLAALVLYVELCQRAGVPLEIWSQPGHVYCVLAGRRLRIEPASRQWQAAAKEIRAGELARRISPVELVGKFYYNRGVELLEARAFEGGVEALRMACQLDPHDTDARTNLLAGLNNWALALAAQDQPAAASALIARGLAIDPAFAPLVANERYVAELARVRASSP